MGILGKLFKPFKRVFKRIGKAIKRGFQKVGKWFGKLGIFGQIALSFIPGLGPMLSGLFKGLGAGASRLLSTALKAGSAGGKIVRGAAWIVDTARKVVGGIQKGFKTVTSAATSFVKNTTKWLGNRMGFKVAGPTKFFGKGTDSVLGQVGVEVSNNFQQFKDVTEGFFSGPSGRATALDNQLNITKVGGVGIDKRSYSGKESFVDPTLPPDVSDSLQQIRANELSVDVLKDFKLDLSEQVGPNAVSNLETVLKGKDFANLDEFGQLKAIQSNPEYFNKVVYAPDNSMAKWLNYDNKLGGAKEVRNPFGKIYDIDTSTRTFGEKFREGLSVKSP
ncbi:MAG: hypothetical protein CMM25_05570, partial [Rhodospirillaceae bacterium]|nr:hypothetical protein [Rhodospirillaceae bacterium]